jgi:hypothetical protein
MKKLVFLLIFGICALVLFTQPEGIPFKVFSYQISTRQLASQYTKAELIISDETQSWEIILYRKDGKNSEHIKLEQFDDINQKNHGVFRNVTIVEAAGTSGSNLFAYMPVFEGNKIRVDLCDKRTEGVKRRLIIEY